jgi:hypothetical protein
MKLDVKALAIALGVLWGLAIFLTAVANLIWPTYGRTFLEVVASVYPGYTAEASVGQAIVGALYGAVDGAVTGLVLAWLYNRFVRA